MFHLTMALRVCRLYCQEGLRITMKHMTKVTQSPVAKAGGWQDNVCIIAQTLNAILGFFGGSSPILMYVDDKCAIPAPNDTVGE